MAEGSPGPQFTVSEALWTLLSAAGGVSEEAARARLIATGIPSLTACNLSAVALLDERQDWTLIGQADGEELNEAQAAEALPDLEPLFLDALERGHIVAVATDVNA